MSNLIVAELSPSTGAEFPTFPQDINDDGLVVGNQARFDDSFGQQMPVAVTWQGAIAKQLPLNGHILSIANDVNAHGDVAGRWGGGVEATVWPGSGMLRWNGAMVGLRDFLIDQLGVYASECWGINDNGLVALTTYSSKNRAFAYRPASGGLVEIDPLAGYLDAAALAVNNNDVIAGICRSASDSRRAFLFDGALHDAGDAVSLRKMNGSRFVGARLPEVGGGYVAYVCDVSTGVPQYEEIAPPPTVLQPVFGPFVPTEAWGINSAGDVVGSMSSATLVGRHGAIPAHVAQSHRAFLRRARDGQTIDLNSLIEPRSGWILQVATGINERGVICGQGLYRGQPRGFLMLPFRVPHYEDANPFAHIFDPLVQLFGNELAAILNRLLHPDGPRPNEARAAAEQIAASLRGAGGVASAEIATALERIAAELRKGRGPGAGG